MAWCFEDEAAAYADAVLDHLNRAEAVVPSIWPLEVANVLLVAERRKRLTLADATRFLGLLRPLPISIDEATSRRAFNEVMSLARGQGISSYDAAYLELALRSDCAIATFDAALRAAADRLGIAHFEG